MSPPRPSGGPIALAAAICLMLPTATVPPVALATHDIPHLLDEVDLPSQGGYAAWRIHVDEPAAGDRAELYLDLGNHARPHVDNATIAHLGLWFVNLDHDYVWWAVGATYEPDAAAVHVQTKQPAPVDHGMAQGGSWEDWAGGQLPVPPGEWLIVAFWATDGDLEASMAIGSQVQNGTPLVTLENATQGGTPDVFAFENGDFDAEISLYAGTRSSTLETASSVAFFPVAGAMARTIQDGEASVETEDRLFGAFVIPGLVEAEGNWTGPQGSGHGDNSYWFHGAAPGAYEFNVEASTDAWTDRDPVRAFGADVDIPEPMGGRK